MICIYLRNKNFFSIFLSIFEIYIKFELFEKKDEPHTWCISEIGDSEKRVRWLSRKFRFRWRFDKEHSQRAQPLLKFERKHLYHIFWSLWRKLSWKNVLFVICKTVRLFINILTADDKYSLLNRDNLTQPIQIQLSQKQRIGSHLFFTYLKSIFSFKHFGKKITIIADVFPKLRTRENVVR